MLEIVPRIPHFFPYENFLGDTQFKGHLRQTLYFKSVFFWGKESMLILCFLMRDKEQIIVDQIHIARVSM